MTMRALRQGMTVLSIAVLLTGCANKSQERIVMLEQANANLTDQLNRMRGELDTAYRGQDDLNSRLAAAKGEAEDLRRRLAEMDTPESAAPGWTAVPGGAMIAIEGNVLFASGKTVVRQEARRTLDAVVSTINGEYADKDIFVFGHTDDQPIRKSGWEDNWQLSTERALSVVRYLQKQGVQSERLAACGCGEHRPRVPNDSASSRARNRRVEIFAVEPQMHTGMP